MLTELPKLFAYAHVAFVQERLLVQSDFKAEIMNVTVAFAAVFSFYLKKFIFFIKISLHFIKIYDMMYKISIDFEFLLLYNVFLGEIILWKS